MNLSLPLFDLPPPPVPPTAALLRLPEPPRRPSADDARGSVVPTDTSPGQQRQADAAETAAAAASRSDSAERDAAGDAPMPLVAERWGGLPALPPVRSAAPRPAPPPHPGLWRASQLGAGRQRCTASGFALLDAQLPGGGWPHGVLTELLLAQPGIGELRLLAPALAAVAGPLLPAASGPAVSADAGRCVMLFDPPAALSAWGLAQQGLASQQWLVVQARAGQGAAPASSTARPPRSGPRTPNGLWPLLPSADLLWALEQALRSGHVGAVLAWLPLGLRADTLRRLQLAAQAHDGPVFIFRDAQARHKPSAAPLRLLLQPAGIDDLSLRLLKRRGPPLAEPLRLALPSVLPPQQQAQARTRLALQDAARPSGSATRPQRGATAWHSA